MPREHSFRNTGIIERVPMGHSPAAPLTNRERLEQWQARWDIDATVNMYPRPTGPTSLESSK